MEETEAILLIPLSCFICQASGQNLEGSRADAQSWTDLINEKLLYPPLSNEWVGSFKKGVWCPEHKKWVR